MSEHVCPICQDKLDDTRIFTPCIHGFHKKCLIQHLLVVEESENYFYDPERKVPCPICRNDIHIITHELRDNNEYKQAKANSNNNNNNNAPVNNLNLPAMISTIIGFNEENANSVNFENLRNMAGTERMPARTVTNSFRDIFNRESHNFTNFIRHDINTSNVPIRGPLNLWATIQPAAQIAAQIAAQPVNTAPQTNTAQPVNTAPQSNTAQPVNRLLLSLPNDLTNFISSYNRYMPYNTVATSRENTRPVDTETLDYIISTIYYEEANEQPNEQPNEESNDPSDDLY